MINNLFFKKLAIISIMVLSFSIITERAIAFEEKSYEIQDPLEKINRKIYKFNQVVDDAILKPAAKTYRFITPRPIKRCVNNFFKNLGEPVTFVNSLLQGDVKGGFTSMWRFIINSTFGIGGLNDLSKEAGLRGPKEDFGQTLGYYGFDSGPYLVLPLLGSSNGRDLLGNAADWFTDPLNYNILEDRELILLRTTDIIDTRESLLNITDEIDQISFDTYVSYRNFYSQMRKNEIKKNMKNK